MFSRSGTRSQWNICRRCCGYSSVERSFSTRLVSLPPSQLHQRRQQGHRKRLSRQTSDRGLTQSTRLGNGGSDEGITETDRHDAIKLSEEEALQSQEVAVEALAQHLQESTPDQAYRGHYSEEYADVVPTGAETDPDLLTNIIRYGLDPMVRVRRSGASSADIVREARNVFGDSLPGGTLTDEELRLYTRLYGEPASQAEIEEDDLEAENGEDSDGLPPHVLYTAEGEQIEYSTDQNELGSHGDDGTSAQDWTGFLPENAHERNERMLEAARLVDGAVLEEGRWEDEEDEDDGEASDERAHPLTTLGKFATSPRTVYLSQESYIEPFEAIMSKYSNKHLKETCQRTFGGPGLPNSPLTPRSGASRQQVPVALSANQHFMGEMEANAFVAAVMPPTYASIQSVLVETRKRLGSSWLDKLLTKEGGPRILDAGSGGVGIVAWREIVQAHWEALHTSDRDPIPPPPPSKAVVLTGSDELRQRAAAMLENTTFIPRLPDYVHTRDTATLDDDRPAQQRKEFDVIIASHSLYSLKEDFLRKQHVQNLWSMLNPEGGVLIIIEKGVPRGFEAVAGAREMLLERYIQSPEGRTTHYSDILDDDLHKKAKAMIVAPCTNHEKCPMYTTLGLSRGRRDICSFQQRYIRPAFLQRVLGAKDRNHDDVDFSYLAVMKGDDLRSRRISTWDQLRNPLSAPQHSNVAELQEDYEEWLSNVQSGFESFKPEAQAEAAASHVKSSDVKSEQVTSIAHPDGKSRPYLPATHNLPRAVFPPMKRRGHVIMDVCTPAGKIERWTIPRSFGKQAFRDARKARWGDLWALGAKTRNLRNLSLGTPEKDLLAKEANGDVVFGKGRGRKERLKLKAMEILEAREESKLEELAAQKELIQELDNELDEVDTPRGERLNSSSSSSSSSSSIQSDARAQMRQTRKESKGSRQKESSRSSPASPSKSKATGQQEAPAREYISPHSDLSDDQVQQILADWQADFDALKQADTSRRASASVDHNGRRQSKKEGGIYGNFGTISRAARRFDREARKGRRDD